MSQPQFKFEILRHPNGRWVCIGDGEVVPAGWEYAEDRFVAPFVRVTNINTGKSHNVWQLMSKLALAKYANEQNEETILALAEQHHHGCGICYGV